MALTALIYSFDVQLSLVDRGVYDSISFKAAQHPSETDEYLMTRVLAYCLEYREGIAFSRGLAEPDEPAITVKDLTGAIQVWIEIGNPSADRLHRASKAAPRVAIYTTRDAAAFAKQLGDQRIHKKEALELHTIDRALVDTLCERLDRRMTLTLLAQEGHLFITVGDDTVEGSLQSGALA
ncbi:MAG: YaeQ family protein [Gemmatimonadaceae bacterium]